MLELNPDLINIINELGISYYKDDNHIMAKSTFEEAISKNPYYPKTFYNYGIFLNMKNEFNESSIQLRRAISLDKYYLNAHFALIKNLIQTDKVNQANAALIELEKIAPNSQHYHMAKQLFTES